MNVKKTALAIGLVLIMAIGTVTGCGKFDGTKTAITVNGENVSAGTLSLMANYDAALVYTYYGSYMGEDYFDLPAGDIFGDEEEDADAEESAEAEDTAADAEDESAAEDAAAEDTAADAEDESAAEDAAAENTAADAEDESTAEDAEAADAEADAAEDTEAAEEEEAEDGPTVGDHMVQDAADQLAELVVISQHAEDYGISLTDEEKAAIDEASQKYVDVNPADVLKKLGTSKEDMAALLTYETIKSKMLPEIAKDVDKNIDDSEAQQSRATSITLTYTDEEPAEDAEAEDTADEEGALPTREEAISSLQDILSKIQSDSDPASCDMDAIAKEADENYSAIESTWSTNDPEQTSISTVLYQTAKNLKDGEVYQEIVVDEESMECSIIRMDSVFDKDATESQKGYIYYQRETDNLDKVVKEWVDSSDIVKNDKVISTIKITGSDLYTLKPAETEETEGDAEADGAEAAEEADVTEGEEAADEAE